MQPTQARILFVDDEASLRFTVSAILERHGYKVTAAASVAEALDAINKTQFDVLLSDLNIGAPGDGFTIVSAMRRIQPRAVTCLLTGYPDFESALKAIREQVDEYFTKPADIPTLVERIKQHIDGVPVRRREEVSAGKRVSQVILENRDLLLRDWLEAVSSENSLRDINLSREDRTDHVPKVLQELARRVDARDEDNSDKALQVAEEHGKTRFEQGYMIPQIIIESRLLQHVLQNKVQGHLLFLDISTVIPDIMRVGESLASIVEETVRSYQEAQRRSLGRVRKSPARQSGTMKRDVN